MLKLNLYGNDEVKGIAILIKNKYLKNIIFLTLASVGIIALFYITCILGNSNLLELPYFIAFLIFFSVTFHNLIVLSFVDKIYIFLPYNLNHFI